MIEIPLQGAHVALIDDADLAVVAPFSWHAVTDRQSRCNLQYAQTNIKRPDGRRTTIRMHRLILGVQPHEKVDHKNHNGLDNRRENLRLYVGGQNHANMRVAAGYKGVVWSKSSKKWLAQIIINKEYCYLGLFTDPWEAAQTYNAAALEAWGEYAHLNERKTDE